jgi:hypothetical protein
MNNQYHWKFDVPTHVVNGAAFRREISLSDAKVIYKQALEVFRRELSYKREWPRCDKHWNTGLDKWICFAGSSVWTSSTSAWAVLVCSECHGSLTSFNGFEYFRLSDLEKLGASK